MAQGDKEDAKERQENVNTFKIHATMFCDLHHSDDASRVRVFQGECDDVREGDDIGDILSSAIGVIMEECHKFFKEKGAVWCHGVIFADDMVILVFTAKNVKHPVMGDGIAVESYLTIMGKYLYPENPGMPGQFGKELLN